MIADPIVIAAKTANAERSVTAVRIVTAVALKNNIWQDQKTRGGYAVNPVVPVLSRKAPAGKRVELT